MAQTVDGMLDELTDASSAREKAISVMEEADAEWRSTIRRAIEMRVPVTQIAAATGISRERVYQIRDGRR